MLFDRNKLSGLYDKSENVEELISWLLSDSILNKLQQSFFEFEAEGFADEISCAEKVVTTVRGQIK